MAAKQTATGGYANNLLSLIFNATTYAGFAINATSGPLATLWVSLHTAALTGASTQATSEAAYPSYARVGVARTTGGWTVATNTVQPAATISFPASTGSPSETETYFGIGTTSAGAGALLYYGSISPTIAITASGITPQLTTGSMVTEI